jgi:small multidrug resistance pump
MGMHWLFLALAIACEVVATLSLKASAGLTRPGWVAAVVVGYLCAFAFLGLSLRTLPVGLAYAVWAAVGILLVGLAGHALFEERLDAWAVVGMVLIVIGVVLLTAVSDSAPGLATHGREGAP